MRTAEEMFQATSIVSLDGIFSAVGDYKVKEKLKER